MDFLIIAYILNGFLIGLATYTDIKEKIIPHYITIIMFLLNVSVGFYYFGFDSIAALISTLILGLILGVGMGGGDIKLFATLAPIFAYSSFLYVPIPIFAIILLSFIFASIWPMKTIFIKYWKEIVPSAGYMAMIIGLITYVVDIYALPYKSIFVWGFAIISILLGRKFEIYGKLARYLGYMSPLYLLAIYAMDNSYFLTQNVLLNYAVYGLELSLLSVVIYALTGAEISIKKPISELKEGDIIRDIIIINGDNVSVNNSSLFKRIKIMFNAQIGKIEGKVINLDGEGLSNEDIDLIKDLNSKGKITDVNILKTYPFVPFVLLSYITILLLKYLNICSI
ncbi:A24 family peptidase C-terminal domain-containing protein [Methanococcus voltae]|uniref:Peptidase A24A domain protein n=1 Tax=Methanococcus voltae (strain ATCC BAA-1334 / A3) TaxID=456320 RepID=D7DUR7_METV3|nr:A24 family peptidase C-terminal domain-containing protein [Methanococcus voltae]MCS3900679.1 preflagellin peptidase FlaK [Methanococcus voltae]